MIESICEEHAKYNGDEKQDYLKSASYQNARLLAENSWTGIGFVVETARALTRSNFECQY